MSSIFSSDCTTWSEEESLRRAAVYGDMDGLEHLNYQKTKEIHRMMKDILKRLEALEEKTKPRLRRWGVR